MPRRKASLKKTGASQSPSQLPRIWLMTDLRFGDRLLSAVQALPFGSGVVFRHYQLPAEQRQRLFFAVRKICRRRGHILVLAAPPNNARHWDYDGLHNQPGKKRTHLHSASVHSVNEQKIAMRHRVHLVFISPIFATKSHPDARGMGPLGIKKITNNRQRNVTIIALGGMTRSLAAMFKNQNIQGWSGIDAFL